MDFILSHFFCFLGGFLIAGAILKFGLFDVKEINILIKGDKDKEPTVLIIRQNCKIVEVDELDELLVKDPK